MSDRQNASFTALKCVKNKIIKKDEDEVLVFNQETGAHFGPLPETRCSKIHSFYL